MKFYIEITLDILKAPADLERVIKGEIKGQDLDKYNATALKDWNDAALVACEHCKR